MKCIEFTTEPERIRDFLKLPKRLYSRAENMENPKEIRRILLGEHPLCKYFELNKFIVYDEKKPVARFAMTRYPQDDTAYFGFFECENNPAAAKEAFRIAQRFAETHHCKRIVGPVDASFWIKYRLKINKFDTPPYTGEPYNKDYYLKLFQDNGFKICEHYTSNQYKAAQYEYINKEYEGKYREFEKKGYEIRSLKLEEFGANIKVLYKLLTELYSDFPIYKDLSEADFIEIFKSYKSIIDPSMVKFGYKDGKIVGFFISVPNYGNIVYHLRPLNILKLLRIRKQPQEYIMLYIGVDQKHHGLGRALVYSIIQELNQSKKPSIGALARDGKVTQNYAKDMIEDVYEYVLLEKKLDD